MTTPVQTEVQANELVRDVLRTVAPGPTLDGLDPHDDLRETLGLDSLDFLTVVSRTSERTGIRIDEDDYDQLADLNGWITLLTTRSARRAG
ncbi:acyl carrier protein [Pseudonocardia acaciae]|uniref:acyl carrier protein n=1 Tax=Pseudonocardia acaciae TaxID=551276 RepID=UPI00048CAB0A|nr:acyl carrier protein [Pseudonocardia acaciae]